MSEQGNGTVVVDQTTGEVLPAKVEKPAPRIDQGEVMGFTTASGFALLQRAATMLAASSLVPQAFQGNVPNCAIAINMALRIGADPLMVAQNLYVVHGRPAWSSQFLIATFNQNGRFSAIRYEWQGEPGKADRGCRAYAVEKATGEVLRGSWITWALVEAEGWASKSGSKWKTMADQMFMYRAAGWFVRAYAPEIAMGLQTAEELHDVVETVQVSPGVYRAEGAPVKEGQGGKLDQLAADLAGKVARLNDPADTIAAEDTKELEAAILADKEGPVS